MGFLFVDPGQEVPGQLPVNLSGVPHQLKADQLQRNGSYPRQWWENVGIICGYEGDVPGREQMSDRRLKTHYLVTRLKRRGRDELTDTCCWVQAWAKTANGRSLCDVLNLHVDASSPLGRYCW